MTIIPKVSVLCAVYNHEKTLKECLDGVFMQVTDFDFEVIARDDASTDGSYQILRSYQEQYPGKLRIIREEKNRFGEGVRAGPILLREAKGNYVAICEGDDFWTDPEKLQIQVDYLETHPGTSLVFTDRQIIGESGFGMTHWPKDQYHTRDVLTEFVAFTQTIMFRNIPGISEFMNVHKGNFFGDKLTSYYMSLFGTLDRIPRVTAAYRQDGGGIWSSLSQVERKKGVIEIYARLRDRFSADPQTSSLSDSHRAQSLLLAGDSLAEKFELLKWLRSRNMLGKVDWLPFLKRCFKKKIRTLIRGPR